MQWSKRKKNVEGFFSDLVFGRIELRTTHYRGSHDEEGRGYITFDKTEIWSICTLSFYSIEQIPFNKSLKNDVKIRAIARR